MRSIWIFLTLLFASVSGTALAEKRVALVIGNSAYLHVPQLANPKNDAGSMSAKLNGLGFEVVTGQDLDLIGMRKSIRDFVGKLDGADIALFFYAGHGLQVNGSNYMAPVDAQLGSYDDLDFEALPIELVLSAMERNAKVNLVFLDACRDNPLAATLARSMGTRSTAVGRGLAKLETGIGSLIAFATQPGNVALDGATGNSPFTTALLKYVGTPGRSLTDELTDVRRAVLAATGGKQVPWESSSLTGPVFLNPSQVPNSAAMPPAATADSDKSVELAYWNTIKDSTEKSFFEAYLRQFPTGAFSALAQLKIDEIQKRKEAERTAAATTSLQQPELAYWNTIKDSTEKSSFEAYLRQFPTGAFSALAQFKIDEIQKRKEAERTAAATTSLQQTEKEHAANGIGGSNGMDVASLANEALTGPQIKELVAGHTFKWKSAKHNSSGTTRYDANGTITVMIDAGKPETGKWRIKGDKICDKSGKSKETCSSVSRVDDKTTYWAAYDTTSVEQD